MEKTFSINDYLKKNKSVVKYITEEYQKGVTYSKEEMSKYEGINIFRDEKLKKWSILITPTY